MKIEHKELSGRKYVTVLVAPNEIMCDVRAYPNATWLGTIDRASGKINVWTPCGYVPRGWRKAALRALEDVRSAL